MKRRRYQERPNEVGSSVVALRRSKKLIERIESLNRRCRLIDRGDRVVVGVSGGPDSIALLYLLDLLKTKYSLKLIVAHLDHGLRGRDSGRDATFVKRQSRLLGIPVVCKKCNVKRRAMDLGRSLEETGRIERYGFFEAVARKAKAGKIATAHTLDDQAETVLFRLIRGAGLRGLSGIPEKRLEGRYQVIRPLISSKKNELIGFLHSNRIPFRKDASNQKDDFVRNRIRRHLLPLLEKHFNPRIKEALESLGAICRAAQDHLEKVSRRQMTVCQKSCRRQKITLDLRRLRRAHPAILGEMLCEAYARARGDRLRVSAAHIGALSELITTARPGARISMPGGVVAFIQNGDLTIKKIRR